MQGAYEIASVVAVRVSIPAAEMMLPLAGDDRMMPPGVPPSASPAKELFKSSFAGNEPFKSHPYRERAIHVRNS